MATQDISRESLPRGTVTLLFADIEGSTRLLHALGEGYAPVRARMREIVRETAAERSGSEVDWAGDGVFLAFGSARDGVLAAVELQRKLAREPWPSDSALRVRIGLHTGEPDLVDEGYVGMDVVVAARICAAGHGGQVVVSRATRDFVGDDGPSGVSFQPLGSHRLKDVPGSHALFQAVAADLEPSFPPLSTHGGSTLPALHHRLVGRKDDLSAIQSLLARPEVRLVTITGHGGAGKSRLALEAAAAAALERPVNLVGLAPVSDPTLVLAEIARAVGAREPVGRPIEEGIAEALRGTGTLLFLDNLEHLAPAAHDIARLLDLVPDLDVLTTSRTPLRLLGEHVLPLDPLPIDDAATLFIELAAARGVVLHADALSSVWEICRRLDGLPLAIELVAARLVVLPPNRVLQALDEGLALEMEGPIDLPERQRTLRATIAWSYGLLSECQKELHDALGVFAGGSTLEDVRAVSRAEPGFFRDLEALVAWSLVRSDVADGDVRLSMLETVREDAVARLRESGELDELRARHAERFLELAKAAESELEGPAQASWLERLELELDNIRTALDWHLGSGRVEDALRVVSALGHFWRMHGHVSEARQWLSRALEQSDDVSPDVLAKALWWSARQAAAQDDLKAEIPLLEEALRLFRMLGSSRETSFVLGELGWIALQHGDRARAEELCEEALTVARETGDAAAISGQLNYLADVYSARGDHLRALAAHEEALALRRTLHNPMLVTNSTYNLGIAAWENDEIERARAAFDETLALATDLGDVLHTTAAEFMLAELDLRAGELDDAERRIRSCLATYTDLESARSRAECLVVLGGVNAARGEYDEAARLFGAADELRGDAPPNRFELPVIEAHWPVLMRVLGDERFGLLRAEGARSQVTSATQPVVSSVTPH
jgi:predicted ATPase/class 3 adenylate cyclase